MARCRPIYTNTPTSPPINTLNTLNSSFDHPDHAPKMQTALRKSFASGSRMAAGRPSQHRAPKTLLRAASNESEQPAPAKGGSTVFYAGQVRVPRFAGRPADKYPTARADRLPARP